MQQVDKSIWNKLLKEDELNLIVTSESLKAILDDLEIEVDNGDYLIDKNTKERILSNDDSELKLREVGALFPGSKIFIRKNIAGYSQYLVDHRTD